MIYLRQGYSLILRRARRFRYRRRSLPCSASTTALREPPISGFGDSAMIFQKCQHSRPEPGIIVPEILGRRVAINSQLPGLRIRYSWVTEHSSRLSEDPIAVYVCLCNALTDHQVKQAATAAGTTKP